MDQHAIIIADTNGVIQLWSAGAAALFGYPAKDAVGRKLDLVVPEKFRSAHWAGFGHAMNTGEAKADGTFFDAPVLCNGGATRTFRGQLHVLRNENQKAIGAMAIFTST
ncbi:MAG TPA: PAS domain-containing protein [Pseudolabrys sp.]|jgi:PAS domain S-box-containing protein|nr:PAS domain-containing protein [Pseudolabrys sp.]